MSLAALRPCTYPGCNALGYGRCEKHVKLTRRQVDSRRAPSSQRGYDAEWRKYRLAYLRQHPFCVQCEREGTLNPASVVDHIKPHRGDKAAFWDAENHQAMCKRHHDQKTARHDSGFGNRAK